MGIDRNDVVIVVSGVPRSGTSMMMSLLKAGGIPLIEDGQRAADEDNPLGYFELEAVKHNVRDTSWLERGWGRAVKMAYSLLPTLPIDFDYRVVFMVRRLSETVRSQQVMLERQGRRSAGVDAAEWEERFAAEVKRVTEWLSRQSNFAVLEVDYNRTISDPARTVAAVDEFLGAGLDTAAMERAVDPALYRQRQESKK